MADTDLTKSVQVMLGLPDEVMTQQREKIELIIDITSKRLINMLKGVSKSVPDELSYIVIEVSVARYNRIANEGMKSYSQEGESITFSNSDFDEFQNDISNWLDNQAVTKSTLGKVRFIGGGNHAL
ncbi:phage head-tail connector protein [Lapidilactobacillus bayanensis]|uniref:phage head-tail connector protein n=1 Tax=Lapidilactobacillus bayanensis TaxID=2485998 RepID=UPI001CDD53CB|nr:phage head-tail connector protein [Lapidilactobacillus bayanensis]